MDVLIRTRCTACEGTGVFYNAEWREFAAKQLVFNRQRNCYETPEGEWLPEPDGPEELPCRDCKEPGSTEPGSGYIYKWVSLAELLDAVDDVLSPAIQHPEEDAPIEGASKIMPGGMSARIAL